MAMDGGKRVRLSVLTIFLIQKIFHTSSNHTTKSTTMKFSTATIFAAVIASCGSAAAFAPVGKSYMNAFYAPGKNEKAGHDKKIRRRRCRSILSYSVAFNLFMAYFLTGMHAFSKLNLQPVLVSDLSRPLLWLNWMPRNPLQISRKRNSRARRFWSDAT
jgi:hypothetical protein